MSFIRLTRLKPVFAAYSHVLTIFPSLFLFLFASELNIIAQHSLVFRKLCFSIYNESVCHSYIFKNETYQNEIQLLTNEWNLWLNMAFFIPAIFSVLYLVSNADRQSNYRSFMLISLVGFIIFSIICAIASTQDTYTCLYLLLLAQFLNGTLGGGSLAFISSCFSYTTSNENNNKAYKNFSNSENSNKTDDKYSKRSIAFSILESAILFGRFLGSIVSGYLLSNKTNFVLYRNTFFISFAIFMSLLFYSVILFCLSNNAPRAKINISIIKKNSNNVLPVAPTSDEDADSVGKIGYPKKSFKTKAIDKLLYITDVYKVLVKKRENNMRFYFLMFLFIYFLTTITVFGVGTIDYLFLTKIPISMEQTDYGLFRALNTLFKAFALLIILPVLKNYFHVPDYVLFLIGLLSDTANYVVFSISNTVKNMIWLSPVAYMFANYYVVCLRSFVSKLVEANDVGKFFGIISVIEFLAYLIGSSIFNRIYEETLLTLPSAVYLIAALFTFFVCFTLLLFVSIKFNRNEEKIILRNMEAAKENSEETEIDN